MRRSRSRLMRRGICGDRRWRVSSMPVCGAFSARIWQIPRRPMRRRAGIIRPGLSRVCARTGRTTGSRYWPPTMRAHRCGCGSMRHGRRRPSTSSALVAARLLRRAFPDAVKLPAPVAVDALPGFADGDVSVQDAAAQIAADVVTGKRRRAIPRCLRRARRKNRPPARARGERSGGRRQRCRTASKRVSDNLQATRPGCDHPERRCIEPGRMVGRQAV